MPLKFHTKYLSHTLKYAFLYNVEIFYTMCSNLRFHKRFLKRHPVIHPSNGISIEFEIQSNFGVLWFQMCSNSHNEILQCYCYHMCKILLWLAEYFKNKSTANFRWISKYHQWDTALYYSIELCLCGTDNWVKIQFSLPFPLETISLNSIMFHVITCMG